jgi:hypothetical protein
MLYGEIVGSNPDVRLIEDPALFLVERVLLLGHI